MKYCRRTFFQRYNLNPRGQLGKLPFENKLKISSVGIAVML